MNIETIKSKNNYSSDAVKNRLIRIEKILQQLTQSLGNEVKNNVNTAKDNNLLENLSLPYVKAEQIGDLNRTVTNPRQMPAIQQKDNKNSLLLSRGQVMAELAMAIMRANQRNF